MAFRVTPQIFIANAIQASQTHNQRILGLQRQITTGLRIEKPSDDPAKIGPLLANKAMDKRLDVNLENIEAARFKLNQSVTQLLEAVQLFRKAKVNAIDGVQSQDPESLAAQVDSMIERLLAIANTADGGQQLYSGTAVLTLPFSVQETDEFGAATGITYQGSDQRASVVVGARVAVETLYSGRQVFQPVQRAETIFIGETGANAGKGTDSGRSAATLTVRHTSTSYAAASGVQPGASSVAEDTIIGPSGRHALTINDTSGNGTSGTVSLNGGTPVAFTSADTNLRVSHGNDEVVYVDMSSISAGFNGQVDITADGTLSTDGGATEVAIDFSDNQIVTDSRTGVITNVDSTSITRAGDEYVEYTGTADAFQALMNLRDDLLNTRDLTTTERTAALQRRQDDIERIHDHLLRVVGDQSVSLTNLDGMQNRTEQFQLETRTILSEIESADLSEVVLQFQSEQNLLQFTYASSVQLMQSSLLDYI